MIRLLAFTLGIQFLCLGVGTAAIYRWTDANGRVHLTDRPPQSQSAESVTIQPINTYKAPKPPPGLKKIVLYSTSWCSACKKAKKFLSRNNIDFTEKDIEKSHQAKQEFARLGGRGVPLILIGETKLRGYNKSKMRKYLSDAGYQLN